MIQLIQLQQARMKGASLLPTVSLRLTAVGVTTRVAFGDADVWKRETFLLFVYCYSTATTWITNISGIHYSWAIRPPLTTNLPTFSQIFSQIQHRHMPIKLLSLPLVMPWPFLTTTSMTLDWTQSPVATRQTHPTPQSPSLYDFFSFLLFYWCPTPFSSEETRALLLCWNWWRILWSCPLAEKYIHCPLRHSWEGVCVWAEQTAQGLCWRNSTI